MKKVGILSMQNVTNYGSFLQGFALKNIVESFGCLCEFIDIEQGIVFPDFKRSIPFLICKLYERYIKWDFIKRLYYTIKFQKRFKKEFSLLLGIDVHEISYFDIAIIGSDEVFNFAQKVPWGFTSQLYGRINNAGQVISYAGSFGHTTIEDIIRYGVNEKITSA